MIPTETVRTTPPAAVQLLVPVWGHRYVREFLEFSVPTLLAPGNVPALAARLPCTFTILTSQEDELSIRLHPTFRALSALCNTEIRLIDHLITGSNYSTSITLAYAEAVRASGTKMLDTCFFFLVSDYIVADGSLANALARMMKGVSGVLVGNFQVALEDALPWLREQLDGAAGWLAVPPRELMRWALCHLHPATVANIVNFPLGHNTHTNRLFWRVDGDTLLGRFFLMHMLCIRPETSDFFVESSCDYSFIPEMCPSNNVAVMTDSDDYLVIEIQPRDHEAAFLRPGPPEPRRLARVLSEWTTERHRENSRYSIVFHSAAVPEALTRTIAEAESFLRDVSRVMNKQPKPYRSHPYWKGAIAAHKDATGQRLSLQEWRLVMGLEDPVASDSPIRNWLVEQLRFALFKLPIGVRIWHPHWADYRPVLRRLEGFMRDPQQRLIMVSEGPTMFTASLADGGERAVRLKPAPLLDNPAEFYEPLSGQFDVCLIELAEEGIADAGHLVDRIAPMMKVGGQILIIVYNKRAAHDFAATIGSHAARLMRPSATPVETHFVPASRVRLNVARAMRRLGRVSRDKPWIGIPALLAGGGLLAAYSAAANLATGGKTKRRLRPRQQASSFLITFRLEATDKTGADNYSPQRLIRQRRRRRVGSVDPPRVSPPSRSASVPDRAVAAGSGQLEVGATSAEDVMGQDGGTREPQYNRCLTLKDEFGLTQLGLMTNQVWHDDPRRLGILLARYKFVAKMLSGRRDVGEVGCGDAFGSRVVLQEVGSVTVYDFDRTFIDDIRQRRSERWPIEPCVHDILLGPLPRQHDGIYSLDVIEHIDPHDEHAYLANLHGSLTDDGVLIIGSPSLESQPYASPPSRAGHVNCKSAPGLKTLLERYFQNVFIFSMNDEVVHTGFYPMAHYLLATCCGKKNDILKAPTEQRLAIDAEPTIR